jgi:hypothetical protein
MRWAASAQASQSHLFVIDLILLRLVVCPSDAFNALQAENVGARCPASVEKSMRF